MCRDCIVVIFFEFYCIRIVLLVLGIYVLFLLYMLLYVGKRFI